MRRVSGTLARIGLLVVVVSLVSLVACGSTVTASKTGTATGTATATITAAAGGAVTATPGNPSQPFCPTAITGMTPFNGINGAPGLQMPSGTYISAPTSSGGGDGQYSVQTYQICYGGSEALIDGGNLTPSGTPTSTVGHLAHSGWKLNNLFPDPTSVSYLDYCSAPHICVNTSGSGVPFAFVGFDKFDTLSVGYTLAYLAVATLATPICLNDVGYYSGTPKYTLYFDGNSVSGSSVSAYHFQMPPGTRVSTFNGGGTAGSTYDYFCSAGSTNTVVSFLQQAMQNVGWSVTPNSTGFTATEGSSPTYRITLNIRYPNNYSLQVFVPM